MHKITFFPLGNADCSLIELENGRKIILDYAAMKDETDKADKRCDLKEGILSRVEDGEIDVFVITHIDEDHIKGISDLFYLEQAAKYQEGDRIKIKELWVPAAVILETSPEGESRIVRDEARHRLRNKGKIKVVSNPEKLEEWLENQNLKLDDVRHLIMRAGSLADGFSLEDDGVEFFIHSPFSKECDGKDIDRNNAGLLLAANFEVEGQSTKVIFGADVMREVWEDIIAITKWAKNEDRLEWDIFDISHHCSCGVLADDKDDIPKGLSDNIKWLYEEKSNNACIMISKSKPIKDDDKNPPCYKAQQYYKSIIEKKNGKFIVTMEHPNENSPKPFTIHITKYKAEPQLKSESGPSIIIGNKAPRQGK